jgi:hypothetical protein
VQILVLRIHRQARINDKELENLQDKNEWKSHW